MSVQNLDNPYEYVTIRGEVADVTPEGADDHIDAMAKKYLDQDEYPFRAPDEKRLIVRVRPERVHHYGA
jgi:hypothetical protein